MTYERFKEIWKASGIDDIKVENPIMVDSMSKHTIDALVACSHGDFSHFDEIQKKLEVIDAQVDLHLHFNSERNKLFGIE